MPPSGPQAWLDLASLLDEIEGAQGLEEAAEPLLQGLLAEASRRAAEGTTVLRTCLHLRGDPTRSALMVAEHETKADQTLPSTTAWWWVEQGHSVRLDVVAGILSPEGQPPRRSRRSLNLGDHTRQNLGARRATHLYAVPGLGPDGQVSAMLSVEVEAPSLAKAPLPLWDELSPAMGVLGRLVVPRLLLHPLAAGVDLPTDELVPVIGATMQPVLNTMRRYARFEEPILMTGRTGVGKSRLAEWVHKNSPRSKGPFVVADLTTIADTTLESTLFGSVKGAFTDARDKAGLFEEARNGTIFIDEVNSLPLALQTSLLRVLETGRFRRVGETGKERSSNARVVLATNQPLPDAVNEGTFREDLYHRIAALPAHIPTLLERQDELLPWAWHFLAEVHGEAKGSCRFAADTEAVLRSYSWPGNLRELHFCIVRAYAEAAPDDPDQDVVVHRSHIEEALPLRPDRGPLHRTLVQAAQLWADQLMAGDPDLIDKETTIFRQYVRRELCERMEPALAFSLLGLEGVVNGRSHHRKRREAIEAVRVFEEDDQDG